MWNLSWKPLASLLLLLVILSPSSVTQKAAAQIDNHFGVYVQDEADLLTQQDQLLLYQKAVWLQKNAKGAQIGILTVPTLGNQTLETLAVARFREMGLGSKAGNNGVLLLYTAQEDHVRIEVGYGLEGRITDGKAGAILDQYFIPHLKAGEVAAAFAETQLALIREVAAEYNVDISQISDGTLPSLDAPESSGFFDSIPGYLKLIIGIALVILIILDFKFTGGMVTFTLLSMFRGGRSSGGGNSGGGWGGRGGGGSSGGGGASR
ncbi:TPM domain-containing protein [Paenibacillus psychroresistens]|uniref:TPM domain-containing protein n=1 Tax=Paenibacillus psychroresistens TaxID=1778678 RepID=A0A6B8RRI3_9BACL|nr:TPM domain-containing protein [Paenibacillus psychroresistens]QGQ97878.1 TPM domain-containing protein [Paenibacillus psychroresistens]